jgi:hypothetical protein
MMTAPVMVALKVIPAWASTDQFTSVVVFSISLPNKFCDENLRIESDLYRPLVTSRSVGKFGVSTRITNCI